MIHRLVQAATGSDAMMAMVEPLSRDHATILMLHRFANPETETAGHDPGRLSSLLQRLRRRRYRLTSLSDLVAALEVGRSLPPKTVVFTVDDGYADFASVGAPVFAAFDCPVTVFLITGFLDGLTWCWWDMIAFAFDHTEHCGLHLEVARQERRWEWTDESGKRRACGKVIDLVKEATTDVRAIVISQVAAGLEVEFPGSVPLEYAPMTWAHVRAAAGRGVTFGPHTVTHPMLPQVDTASVDTEIADSWRRVREETTAAVPVFCYPNGASGARERDAVARLGPGWAVTTEPTYVSSGRARDGRTTLPRHAYWDDVDSISRLVAGTERIRSLLGGIARRRG